MIYRSWMSELRKNKRVNENKNTTKKDVVIKEDLRTDLRKFMDEVESMQKEVDTLPKSHTALIDSNSLTNFLLWKLLKGV